VAHLKKPWLFRADRLGFFPFCLAWRRDDLGCRRLGLRRLGLQQLHQRSVVMGYFLSPRGPEFDPGEVAILQEAFNAVWATIVAHRPSQGDNQELKTMVSEKLCAIAATGVMDVHVLRSRTLASLEWPRPAGN
jgi:hypothetical protein